MSIGAELEMWAEQLWSTGYRGLVVLHCNDLGYCTSMLLARVPASNVVCIAPSDTSACKEVRRVSPSSYTRILGTEQDMVILAIPKLLRPNLIAAAAEAVKGPGVLALVVPPLDSWQPGGQASTSAYRSYLIDSFYTSSSIFWADADREVVYLQRLPPKAKTARWSPADYKSSMGVPRRLIEACVNEEQAKALDVFIEFMRRRGRSFIVVGDRGRGKSGILALIVALLVYRRQVGFLPVTAPSPENVQSFFRVLDKALSMLDVKHWTIERYGYTIGVAGPWFHIRYHTPDRAEVGPFTVVDEAAALGPTRLMRIARRSPRILAATTIHGYEGSGKTFTHIILSKLPDPKTVYEVTKPARYPPGDPLEDWVYTTFMLRVEEPPPPSQLTNIVFHRLDRKLLARNRDLLRLVYSILVQAHYRNEPDDLALMIDAPHHDTYMLEVDGTPVAVAETSIDSMEIDYTWRMSIDLLNIMTDKAAATRGLRIVRIAVHTKLQRRGLGSRLLSLVEEDARRRGFDWVSAVFSRQEVLGFWLKNGYRVAYISPRPNRVTGERNILVVKPLTRRGEELVTEAASEFARRLLASLPTTYKTLPASTVAAILTMQAPLPPQPPTAKLSKGQQRRLSMYLSSQLDYESASDAVYLAVVNKLLELGFKSPLSPEDTLLLVARVLQGHSLHDVASWLRTSEEEVNERLRRAVQNLIGVGSEAPAPPH